MDNSVAPTIEDGGQYYEVMATGRKPKIIEPSKGGWHGAIFIIFVEVAERFAYYGLAGNLITFLTNNLHQPTPTAVKNVNTWIGVSALSPFIGAIIADSYLGRFNTILLSSLIYFAGMVLLMLSVSVIPLHYQEAVFFVALYILCIGEGGHKPCVQTFAADQFDEDNPQEKAAKSSFFNWWYLSIVSAASTAVLVVIYIQDNIGWAAGFGMLAVTLVLALVIFLVGIKKYRKEAPVGSPVLTVAHVVVAAMKKRRVRETPNGRGIYKGEREWVKILGQSLSRTNQFRFLDKAMIIDNSDATGKDRNPWRLCSLNQVEEVKSVLRLIPVWLTCLMFTAVLVQTHTFFVKQGSTMNRSLGPNFKVPPASLQSLVGLGILITMPLYDRVLVPIASKITGHHSGITMLQRIGIGLFISVIQMIVAALVEAKRLEIVREHTYLMDNPKGVVPMSVWWLLPQYILGGVSDIFTIVGLQELFYDQMPEEMRSIGAAAYLSLVGVGSFVNTAIVSVVQAITARAGVTWIGDNLNRARIDCFYWVLAGLSGLNLCFFIWVAMSFEYKKVEGDDQECGRMRS